MADSISLNVSVDGISKTLQGMISRTQLVRGWLNRVGYPMIIAAQRQRWQTEGASEGNKWKPLNPGYAMRKLKKWKDAPGGGRKMLIASGKLVDSVTGDDSQSHYKLVEERKISVGSLMTYAKYVNDERNFTDLSNDTIYEISEALGKYIRTGDVG